MALSKITYAGDGVTTQFAIPFALGYIEESDITVQVNNEVDGLGEPLYRTLTFESPGMATVGGTVPAALAPIVFTRTVDRDSLIIDYEDGDIINKDNLNTAQKQAIMLAHEALDGRFEAFQQDLDMGGFQIKNLEPGTEADDAVTLQQLQELASGDVDFNFVPVDGSVTDAKVAPLSRLYNRIMNVKCAKDPQFGAKGDGVTDDTAALNLLWAQAGNDVNIEVPSGNYIHTGNMTLPLTPGIRIRGYGATLTYNGPNDGRPHLTVGDGIVNMQRVDIQGLTFDSAITLTSGVALRIRKVTNGARLQEIDFGLRTGLRRLFDCIEFSNCNVVEFQNSFIYHKGTGVRVFGDAAADTGSDMTIENVHILATDYGDGPGNYGYHIAGGMGGVYFRKAFVYGANYGFVVDAAVVARGNRELFWDKHCIADACNFHNLLINDAQANGAVYDIGVPCLGAGFLAGAVSGRHNMNLLLSANAKVNIHSPFIHSAKGAGIMIGDASMLITVMDDVYIYSNVGAAIDSTVSVTANLLDFSRKLGNGAKFGTNVRPHTWRLYNSTVQAGATPGAFAATGSVFYYRVDNLVYFRYVLNVTNHGTATDSIVFYLPLNANGQFSIPGRIDATRVLTHGLTTAGSGGVGIVTYAGAYPGSTQFYSGGGMYECVQD